MPRKNLNRSASYTKSRTPLARRAKEKPAGGVFAVRCLFSFPSHAREREGHLYEERITLWEAESFEDAFAMAKKEAIKYAEAEECVFHFAASAFQLFEGEPEQGKEVWSWMRSSHMAADMYRDVYLVTLCDRVKRD